MPVPIVDGRALTVELAAVPEHAVRIIGTVFDETPRPGPWPNVR